MSPHGVIGTALFILLTPSALFDQSREVSPNRRQLDSGLSVEGMSGWAESRLLPPAEGRRPG